MLDVLDMSAGVVCVEVVPEACLGLLPRRRLLPEALRRGTGSELSGSHHALRNVDYSNVIITEVTLTPQTVSPAEMRLKMLECE